jgi:hypothetical protein
MRERTRQTWVANFEEFSGESFSITAPDFALSLLEGLALSQRTAPDPAIVTSVVDALKDLSTLLDPTNQEFSPNRMFDLEDT